MSKNYCSQPDEELILLAANGDLEPFGCIYERYLAAIFRYIYYRISDIDDAEDLTEELFLRVWNRLQKLGPDPGIRNFKAWLYRIAHNLVVDYHRSRSRKDHENLQEDLRDPADGVEEISIKNQDKIALEMAIQELGEVEQQVIVFRFISRLSHMETAKILDLSEAHVRVIQYRALKKLRRILEKDQ